MIDTLLSQALNKTIPHLFDCCNLILWEPDCTRTVFMESK
jgi:hypothetical protein